MTDVFTVVDGYDRNRVKRTVDVRRMTLDEVKGLRPGQKVDFIANDGTLRRMKVNGNVKRWKRDPDRVEVPVKYGMYECGTLDKDDCLRRFVVVLWTNHPTGLAAQANMAYPVA